MSNAWPRQDQTTSTRTLGVAFDGCTLPGADRPLFTVLPGSMDLGLGIHGEPGGVQPRHADGPPNWPPCSLTVSSLKNTDQRNGSCGGHPQRAGPHQIRGTVRGLEGQWRHDSPRRPASQWCSPKSAKLVTSLGHGRLLTNGGPGLDDELERLWDLSGRHPPPTARAKSVSATDILRERKPFARPKPPPTATTFIEADK